MGDAYMLNMSELSRQDTTKRVKMRDSTLKSANNTRKKLMALFLQMETELQAKDVAIATLTNEKLKLILHAAQYGDPCNPISALLRDRMLQSEDSIDVENIREVYRRQLDALYDIISTHAHSNHVMRNQYEQLCKLYDKIKSGEGTVKSVSPSVTLQVVSLMQTQLEKQKKEMQQLRLENFALRDEISDTETLSHWLAQGMIRLLKERMDLKNEIAERNALINELQSSLDYFTNKTTADAAVSVNIVEDGPSEFPQATVPDLFTLSNRSHADERTPISGRTRQRNNGPRRRRMSGEPEQRPSYLSSVECEQFMHFDPSKSVLVNATLPRIRRSEENNAQTCYNSKSQNQANTPVLSNCESNLPNISQNGTLNLSSYSRTARVSRSVSPSFHAPPSPGLPRFSVISSWEAKTTMPANVSSDLLQFGRHSTLDTLSEDNDELTRSWDGTTPQDATDLPQTSDNHPTAPVAENDNVNDAFVSELNHLQSILISLTNELENEAEIVAV